MAAGNASQTTPVQITHVFMLCCTIASYINHGAYNFDSCKNLTTWCILINNINN